VTFTAALHFCGLAGETKLAASPGLLVLVVAAIGGQGGIPPNDCRSCLTEFLLSVKGETTQTSNLKTSAWATLRGVVF
jgi:hypothetical protein